MKKPIDELNENIDQIVFLLKTKKIMKRHKEFLCSILNMIISSHVLTEKDLKSINVLKWMDEENIAKITAFNSLNHEYVRLSDWLKANQGFNVPAKNKKRIESIMKRISEFPEYSDNEITEMLKSDSSI